ncbi:malate dehydrogenase [Fasciola gigantica]|uniref:Malate dehydrogenase n=1 Tax=Fasciola gigantica TaxID=46835 RepID=A0A504Z4D3_FASGI|nr:malate dehydrogenase [Fasciola gigantica]
MFSRASRAFSYVLSGRGLSTTSKFYQKVAVLGASGGIGQPTSLLLKQSPLVSHLSLYDIAHVKGVAADLSHIETRAQVTAHDGPSQLADCLKDADIVLIPAGVPRKPGMTRDDLFNTNASIVAQLTHACALHCPKAMICIITNPVNCTVPIAAEMLKKNGVYDPHRLFGVTTLDVVRSNTFIADAKAKNRCTKGFLSGHWRPFRGNNLAGHFTVFASSFVPAVSSIALGCYTRISGTFPFHRQNEREKLTTRIQNAGTEVVEAKAGAGSATLSMAYSGVRFATSLMEAMTGRAGVVECAFVQSDVSECEFFATPITLGPNGVERNMGIGKLNEYEIELLKIVIPELKKNIKRGKEFAATFKPI